MCLWVGYVVIQSNKFMACIREDMLSVYQSVKVVSGVMTAAPMFFVTRKYFESGDVVTGVFLLVIGVVAFWLPGFLMDKYISTLLDLPSKIRHWFISKVSDLIPFV